MNVYDSVRMADLLAPFGYTETDTPDNADLVILNTCHIREKAAEKMYSDLGRMREHKVRMAEEGRQMLITVAGCTAQAEGEEIIHRMPYVDMVVGPQSYHNLPDLIGETERTRKSQVQLEFTEEAKFDLLPQTTTSHGASAFVSVQEGCDKFCTFCVVPYTRGAEFSRPVAQVLQEARGHVARGVVEITLLGQNVNAYHGISAGGVEMGLGHLIRELAIIDGLQRIRYTTSHPNDMSDALIGAHRDIEKLMPQLHLPVQSGSDKILKAMNRKHTAAQYLAIIEKLRAARPEMAFSSDFIVGFPGETDADFEDTLRLAETVGFASGYAFKYSPRPGTPAADKENQVAEEVKDARLARLLGLLQAQQLAFNRTKIGSVQRALVERPGKQPGQMIGKSPFMQSIVLENAVDYEGQMVDVAIGAAYLNSLKGELITAYPRPIHQEQHVEAR
jgi:tRNA-2-methylthio-N6-dimethylallyladenosine synthase